MQQFAAFFHGLAKVFGHVAYRSRDWQIPVAAKQLFDWDADVQFCVMKMSATCILKLHFAADREPVFMPLAVNVDASNRMCLALELRKEDHIERQAKPLRTT